MAEKIEAEAERGKVAEVPIRPSIPSGEGTVWADVSTLLRLAGNDLRDDELINGENFNLYAAMSALEIMDPKMDSGIVSTYYSVDEAIENGAGPVPLSFDRTLDVQRIIDIMDHLLACEATWHKGGSLAQTVYSSIYLLRPERTSPHALLHSYCRVIRATCSAVVSAVSDARTNEEEDLFTMAYGLPLKIEGDDKCLSMLHAVEETISRQLRACKASSSKKRFIEDIEPLQTNNDLEEGFCKALLCRLRFRKHFYHTITCMRRPQGKGLELAKKHIVSCLSELDSMLKSGEFLRSNSACGTLEDGVEDKTTASGCQPIGFDATLNSRSATPTPPRAIKLYSWKKAVDYFRKLLQDLEVLCSYSLDPVFESVLSFVADFHKFQPDLVARAFVQLLLVQDGRLYGRNPMFAVICKAALLPDVAKDHDIQKNKTVAQLEQLAINLLRVLCTNTSWQRRKLGKIIQDWRIIYVQVSANKLNRIHEEEMEISFAIHLVFLTFQPRFNSAYTQKLCHFKKCLPEKLSCCARYFCEDEMLYLASSFSSLFALELAFRKEYGDIFRPSVDENLCVKICKHILIWVEEKTYWIASRFLTLGFELDLYSPSEYCMAYWYIYVVLMKLAEKTHIKMMMSSETSRRKTKKKREGKDMGKDHQIPPAVSLFQCYIYVAEGLMLMLAALRNEGKGFLSQGPFNSEHERFMQHFELLQKACLPDHVSYFTFRETTTHVRFSSLSVYNCFKNAQRIAKELRSSFATDPNRIAELRQVEQVAEHNGIALNLICRLGTLDPSLKVSFEFTHHHYLAVAVVKRS